MDDLTYEQALAEGERVGAANADGPAELALFCDALVQSLIGAVSPALVWAGARRKGLTTHELARLCATDALAVEELQWEDS